MPLKKIGVPTVMTSTLSGRNVSKIVLVRCLFSAIIECCVFVIIFFFCCKIV